MDAVLFTAPLWALWRLPDLPPVVLAGARAPRLGLRAVADGLRYLDTRPNVKMTFVVDLIAMITAMPRVLLPAVGMLFLGGGAVTTGLVGGLVCVLLVLVVVSRQRAFWAYDARKPTP